MERKKQPKTRLQIWGFRAFSFFIIGAILAVLMQIIFLFINSDKEINLINLSGCSLQKEICQFTIPDSNIKLSIEISPRPIRMGMEGVMSITSSDSSLVPAFVDFNALEMDLGYNRPNFQKEKDSETHKAAINLSTCTEEVMKWRALIVFERKGRKYGIPIFFEVKK